VAALIVLGAAAVLDMARTAALFPAADRDQMRADFVCYGRAVVDQEWPAMRAGHPSPLVDYWIGAYRASFGRVALHSSREQIAFQDLLILANSRTDGRQQRLGQDTPIRADAVVAGTGAGPLHRSRGSTSLGGIGRPVHALLVAPLAALVAAGLLVVYFLDRPYEPHVGGVQPGAMCRTVVMMRDIEPNLQPSCDQSGKPA
jgi:hypothetical protein